MMNLRVLAVSALLLVGNAGCSLLFSRPPAKVAQGNFPACSTSRWPVVGDVYLAVNTGGLAALAAGAALIGAENQSKESGPSWDSYARRTDKFNTVWTVAAIAAVGTVGLIQSARYGVASARSCDEAEDEFHRTYNEQPEPPPALWYPPPAPEPPGVAPEHDPARPPQ